MEILEDYYRFMRQFPERGIPMDHGVGQNEMEPAISTIDESWSLTRWIVNRSIDFLETRDDTRPFFLNIGFSKPHPPFDPCVNYWQLYANMQMRPPVIGDWSQDPARIPPGFMGPTWVLNGVDRMSPHVLQQARRAYYACITQIDYNLGLLFARLREMGLLENTLIVFSSDHGEMLGDHHMGGKTVFLEGSAHIPMLVRGPEDLIPRRISGSVCDEIVCQADLMPTFLSAAGVSREQWPTCDGMNLLDVFAGNAQRDTLVGAYSDQFCLLQGDWKYLYSSSGGGELLFNLAHDPYEQHDLVHVPSHRGQRQAMRAQLAQMLAESSHKVSDGRELKVLAPAPDPLETRKNRWPGFHSRDYTRDDVLH